MPRCRVVHAMGGWRQIEDNRTLNTAGSVMDASQPPSGFKKGLTQYGDSGFSLFLRKAFIKGAGYTDDALDRPVIGIASTGSAYNPCHGNMPQLLEAVQRGIQIGRAHV